VTLELQPRVVIPKKPSRRGIGKTENFAARACENQEIIMSYLGRSNS